VPEIVLSGNKAAGRVALVDDEDYELVSQFTWHIWEPPPQHSTWRQQGPYAQTSIRKASGRYTSRGMHRMITGWRRTDHADGNGLNNTRSNLRDVSNRQNLQNSREHIGSTSAYKGVHWFAEKGRWRASIKVDGRAIWLGDFAEEITAARAYDVAAARHFGQYARFNLATSVQEAAGWDAPDHRAEFGHSSRYWGVSHKKSSGKWVAYITHNRARINLGTFTSEVEAAMVRDEAARKLPGTRLRLNFPDLHQIAA
jgi:hypothetical protein